MGTEIKDRAECDAPVRVQRRVRRNLSTLERATPREEMEAMQLGVEACEMLAKFGNWDVRQSWKARAEKISDILRRTRNGYKYGP